MIKTIIAITLLIAVSQCTITILSPSGLADKLGNVEYSLANYGNIPYGHTFIGTLYISNPIQGCDDIKAESYDGDSKGSEDDMFRDQNSKIYLLERGDCSFVSKSRNAQNANGKVAIVFNNNNSQGVNDILLMDQSDHSGKGLMISTLFVTYQTGHGIIDYFQEHKEQEIKIKIEFRRPVGKDKYKIKFWMSSMDVQSYEFLEIFYNHYQDLRADKIELDFTPHYFSTSEKDLSKQKEHCISRGRYCTPDLKIGGKDMYSRDVLYEDIRQAILYEMDHDLWWRYVLRFKTECAEPQEKKIDECSYKVLSQVNASDKTISQLKTKFKESFVMEKESDYGISENTVMEIEYKKKMSQNVSFIPTLIFNQEYFRGDVTSDSAIYEFICAGFIDNSPESCKDSLKEYIDFKNKKIQEQQSSSGSNFAVILLIIIGIFVLMLMILFLYRRMIKKEMSDAIGSQVNSAISNYFALNDSQSNRK